MQNLQFAQIITDRQEFVELDTNNARYELHIHFASMSAGVAWVHQSSFASMNMSTYEGRAIDIFLPSAVCAFELRDFIADLDVSILAEGYSERWDGSNRKGELTEEAAEFIEQLQSDIANLSEIEVSDWSGNSTRNTASLLRDIDLEVTPFTTDEQIAEMHAAAEGDEDVIYQGVEQAIIDLRDELADKAESYDAVETIEEARALAAQSRADSLDIWNTSVGFIILELGQGVDADDADLFGHGSGTIEESYTREELELLSEELASA